MIVNGRRLEGQGSLHGQPGVPFQLRRVLVGGVAAAVIDHRNLESVEQESNMWDFISEQKKARKLTGQESEDIPDILKSLF